MRPLAIGLLTALLGATLEVSPATPDVEWPGFRGPAMSGLAMGAKLPEHWSTTDHVRWSVEVPGQRMVVARSSRTAPCTSPRRSAARPFKQPTPGIYGNDYIAELRAQGLSNAEVNRRLRARDNEVPEESDAIRYMVYAFDARTGAHEMGAAKPTMGCRSAAATARTRTRRKRRSPTASGCTCRSG